MEKKKKKKRKGKKKRLPIEYNFKKYLNKMQMTEKTFNIIIIK